MTVKALFSMFHSEDAIREWEHCDYAKDRAERNYLIKEYRMAYGAGYEFNSILLPQKYWGRKNNVKTVLCR